MMLEHAYIEDFLSIANQRLISLHIIVFHLYIASSWNQRPLLMGTTYRSGLRGMEALAGQHMWNYYVLALQGSKHNLTLGTRIFVLPLRLVISSDRLVLNIMFHYSPCTGCIMEKGTVPGSVYNQSNHGYVNCGYIF